MTCSQHCQRAARVQSTVPHVDTGPRTEVIGTWDFKWTPGSVLRVAFQLPMGVSDADVAGLIPVFKKIEELARTWMDLHEGKRANVGLDFGDTLYRVLPPRSDGAERMNISNLTKLETRRWREQRRQMVRDGAIAPELADVEVEFDYELLINLDPLALTAEAYAPNAPVEGKLYLPMAELGSYAKRLDYGVPSMYVGPVAAFAKELPSPVLDRLVAYFTGEHTHRHQMARAVVHEFGHALGMPHENQNPLCDVCPRALNLEDLESLKELYRSVLEIDTALIPNFDVTTRNEFLEWPDNLEFSDWTQHEHIAGSPADSVMTTAHAAFVALGSQIPWSIAFEDFVRKTSPTRHDLGRLQDMYGTVPGEDAPQA